MANVYTVGQVNNYIKNMFAQDFLLHSIHVKGEVSNCKYHSSGHIYFTIKDSQGAMNAIMFAGNRKGLKFQMKEGDKIIIHGSVEVYERDGKYQLYAKSIELDGEGDLFVRFEALKRELEEMGMFDEAYKRPIPKYAKRIGVVTASTGAAIQDIRNVSYRRNPYVQLILFPALVQGEGAAASIVNGIRALEAQQVDVIIVGRGGGSIEDLWAFNEETVARAIFDCTVPVISAVGHQTDWTIADYVADMRAPTPSAAAELAVFDYRQLEEQLLTMEARLNRNLKQQLVIYRQRVQNFENKLCYLSPQNKLLENRKKQEEYRKRLQLIMEKRLAEKKHRFELLARALEGNSPVKKLSGGYAYVENEQGRGVMSVQEVMVDDLLAIRMLDGTISARVAEVKKNEGQ